MLIPTINLDNSNSADVNTIGIATRHETTIGGPNVPGQVDTYTVQSLTGKAQFKVN
ncbi:MAG: hypothetical protein JOZ16_05465 [Methylobacteriaceae bacterium]|nr:hypothetical protein [Methylobacteriaceae bacterium]